MHKRYIDFVHDCRVYKFVHLQLFDVKFLFSKKHIFRKQKRTAVYERYVLVQPMQRRRKDVVKMS